MCFQVRLHGGCILNAGYFARFLSCTALWRQWDLICYGSHSIWLGVLIFCGNPLLNTLPLCSTSVLSLQYMHVDFEWVITTACRRMTGWWQSSCIFLYIFSLTDTISLSKYSSRTRKNGNSVSYRGLNIDRSSSTDFRWLSSNESMRSLEGTRKRSMHSS